MDHELLKITQKLGEHEAAIQGLQTTHQACHGQVIERINTMDQRLTEAQMDLEGLIEQLRGSMGTVSNLDTKIDRLVSMIEGIQQARFSAWEEHNKQCSTCKVRFKEIVDERIAIQGNNIDYMGPVGLIKKYWLFSLLTALVLGDLFNLVKIIQTGWVHTILYKLLGG